MSHSPTPSASGTSSAGAGAGAGGTASGDWRTDVQQSSRNKQVREIAKVLASLEPGASATSKLRLAMQFEDTVFKSADSLADYQKKLSKRLKKLQKNYVPTQPVGATEKQRTIEQLRQAHGESIRYVLKHAQKAAQEMKAKHGDEKARQLEQHLDAARIWAQDLGLLVDDPNNKPNYNMAEDQLERLKSNIERRLDNVRAHVVKLADPDRFFVETLEKAEEDSKEGPVGRIIAAETRKLYHRMTKSSSVGGGTPALDAEAMMREAMDVTNKTIPLPTRSQHNDEKAALIHLEKMRAASSAFLAFLALEDKKSAAAPPSIIKKLHTLVTDGMQFVSEVMKEHRKQSTDALVTLQDAWMKPLELDTAPTNEQSPEPSTTNDGSNKRPRRRSNLVILRSQVLLTSGRKTPPYLVVELRRKGARLIRPTHGQGSHVILQFGQAFSMTIYLVPLLVELRACEPEQQGGEGKEEENSSTTSPSLVSTPTWTSLHHGLATATTETSSTATTTTNSAGGKNKKRTNTTDSTTTTTENELTVWNVKGDYETLGHVVETRLRDASTHATHVLRQCFAHAVYNKESTSSQDHHPPHHNDFELEILEGQALRNFLQLARSTYTPNWEDIAV